MSKQVWFGDLRKMRGSIGDASAPIGYTLGEDEYLVNNLLGRELMLRHTGNIHCRICGKKIKKAYGEGYCFPHFKSDPANAPCVIRPELCEAHEGKGRDIEWERENHDQPHIVYLADSGGLKVGVTRSTNRPGRWIDQGAHAAIELAETPNRALAGHIEVALKGAVSDKTRWQRMLMGSEDGQVDLAAEKARVAALIPAPLDQHIAQDNEPTRLNYPIDVPLDKVKSLNLMKISEFAGRLVGIRGQYLLFEGGTVLNIRRHTGFELEILAS